MYFSILPNIQYDEKPLVYPYSESEFVVAKNLFRKYKINADVFSYAVFFKKYVLKDGETPDSLANKAYGNPFYDWVILITNSVVNRHFDWPLSNYELTKYAESQYDDPYGEIAYYETYEVKAGYRIPNEYGTMVDAIVLEGGLKVDSTFFNKNFEYFNGSGYTTVPGNTVCRPVTVMEDLTKKNEQKREIFLLKPEYFRQFVDDFKKQNNYKKGSDTYISKKLKKTK
tara:strand:+ start:1935 stop:2615 length:681 start_codon:yes stop_codon:yes gene_type:complete